jgi:sugar/nucleoside kinase (ribokinase family)
VNGPVVVVGDIVADLVAVVADRPPEWRSDSPPVVAVAGGTVGNVACALARLGKDVDVLSAIGGDPFGALVAENLEAEGVGTSLLARIDDKFTLVVIAAVGPNIDRFLWIHPSQDAAPWERSFGPADDAAVRRARWVHASGSALEEPILGATILATMQAGREADVPVSLDLNIRPHGEGVSDHYWSQLRAAVDLADVVLGSSEDEVTAITGINDPARAGIALAEGQRAVVVRLGPDGALAIPGGRFGPAVAPPIAVPGHRVKVASTLGAGDVFNAGFITAMLDGASFVDAVQHGNVVAAVSCTGEGSYSAVSREAVGELIAGG